MPNNYRLPGSTVLNGNRYRRVSGEGVTGGAVRPGTQGDNAAVTNPDNTNLSGTEVQDIVQQQAANDAAAAALDTSGLAVNGMGTPGVGGWYGLLGPGGKPADAAAFLAANPGPYQNQYADAMQQTLNGLLNPQPFQYDVNADALYQQIKDNYIRQGRQAMMDTTGQAAALTGGYGNSYGAQAGNQAYQQYLGNLSNIIPELQQLAYQQYMDQQNTQRDNLEAMYKLEGQDYSRWLENMDRYREALALLPAMPASTVAPGSGNVTPDMSGIYNMMNQLYGVGQSNTKAPLDPNMQMALSDYVKNGYGTYNQLFDIWNSGGSLRDVPRQQLQYWLENNSGRMQPGYSYNQTARNYNSAHQANNGQTRSGSGSSGSGNGGSAYNRDELVRQVNRYNNTSK
jgi:hypothetical protein